MRPQRCQPEPMHTATWVIVAALTAGAGDATAGRSDPGSSYIQAGLGTTAYKRADVDLNGDGRNEVFAYLTDQSYCGSGGCTLLVVSPQARGYRVVLRSTVTQLPISLLPTSTRGWRDIGVSVAGGGINRAYLARLRYDGRRYPSNPTVPPER